MKLNYYQSDEKALFDHCKLTDRDDGDANKNNSTQRLLFNMVLLWKEC